MDWSYINSECFTDIQWFYDMNLVLGIYISKIVSLAYHNMEWNYQVQFLKHTE